MDHTLMRRGLVLLLAVLMALSLCACRESPVLQETLYIQNAPVVDEQEEMLNPEDKGEEDEQFDNEETEDAQTQRDAEADQGLIDESGDAPNSLDPEYNQNAGNDWENNDTREPESTPLPADDPVEGEEIPDAPENVGGNVLTGKQVVDATGKSVTLPERVKTVTAVRWAAQMVELLGGTGRLAAADREFLSSTLAKAAFSDLGAVAPLWEGDGSTALSAANFQTLLELKPDVCLEISGENTFTNAQITALQENGIAYVVLPALSSQENLSLTVNLLASILETDPDAERDAVAVAADYLAWANGVAREVSGKIGDAELTGLYISDWDDAATYQLNYTKGVIEPHGSGLAVAYSPLKNQMVSAYMKVAGVVNESTRIRSTHRKRDRVYVAPMFHQFEPTVSGELAWFYSGAGEYGAAYDLFVARMTGDTTYYQLGNKAYPAVIVANEEIRTKIQENWFWQNHPTDESGYVNVSGQSFYCGVVGDYEIYVNPQGMCDWADGSVESPLEAYWVAAVYHGAYALDEVREMTTDFYRQFFHLELTQKQLKEMFGE